MTAPVALIVLSAAFLHALWNAIVKGAGDRVIMLGMIALGHVFPGAMIAAMSPLPAWEAVPFMIASIMIHWGYFYLLNVAYRLGDLSLIYPIARGLAPVLVALGAQVWVEETLPFLAWAGVFCVSLGIMVLTLDVFRGHLPRSGVLAAIAIGVVVAAYTLVDGVGVRASGTAFGYIGWLFMSKLLIVFFVFPSRWDRLRATSPKTLWIGFLGGLVSGGAYALVLYAKSIAPLGVVSALRETSVIFAALIGVLWFGEGPKQRRILAGVIVAMGIIIIAAAK